MPCGPCGGGAAAAAASGAAPSSPAYTAISNYKCGHWSVLAIALVVGYLVGRSMK